jgi:hypothetical protein
MVTLQEWLEERYPTKEDKEKVTIIRSLSAEGEQKEGGKLDLGEFVGLKVLVINGNSLKTPLTDINLSNCANLMRLNCWNNNLTSIDFLNTLPCPEKLEELEIYNNNIQPTDIAFFSKFVNSIVLRIGTMEEPLKRGKRNKFYGSLESYKNLNKLYSICIEATDVDRGLEFLPEHLVKASSKTTKKFSNTSGGYYRLECSPHNTNAKCKAIQDELRPFNYDVEAWQLAHSEKMLISRPEYFTDPNSKDKWLTALNNKIPQVREEIINIKQTNSDKTKKIERLENKLKLLEESKTKLEEELGFLAQENNKLKLTIRELEMKNYELVQKLEQINLISQVEVQPK